MRLAFYAPLKPPGHPVPSGDRAMARAIMAALARSGIDTVLVSTLRSRDGAGDADFQDRLIAQAAAETARLIAEGRSAGWRGWLTYHNYYKAPDLIGPAVARNLNIPYFQVESTRARKRLSGRWARFAERAEAAADAADAIFFLTMRDAETLRRDAPAGQRLIHLRPFLNRADLPAPSPLTGPMLAVGMMRPGDKLASYGLLAEALALLPAPWTLDIVGDGAARTKVQSMMARLSGTVRFLGALDEQTLAQHYGHAALLVWPGVNEAFGLTYLEAQAAGLPVVAQDRPGVREVLAQGVYSAPEEGPAALAARLRTLLSDSAARQAAGDAARAHVARYHLLDAAAETLRCGLALTGMRA